MTAIKMNARRRDTLLFAMSLCWAPLRAQGQQAGKVYRIGWLSSVSYAATPLWPEFVGAMRERGWIEGQHFTVEHLLYEGHSERLPALAAEAVQRKVDLIMCASSSGSMLIFIARSSRQAPPRLRSRTLRPAISQRRR